jgi:hypothetical protein
MLTSLVTLCPCLTLLVLLVVALLVITLLAVSGIGRGVAGGHLCVCWGEVVVVEDIRGGCWG